MLVVFLFLICNKKVNLSLPLNYNKFIVFSAMMLTRIVKIGDESILDQ